MPRRPHPSVGDLIDARVLAWMGGLATLIGILLFLALAASHGWIDLPARVALAGAAAAALMIGGAWLHERRGRTEAALAMVGTGTAGLLATLVVANEVYGLISPLAEVAGSLIVGAAGSGAGGPLGRPGDRRPGSGRRPVVAAARRRPERWSRGRRATRGHDGRRSRSSTGDGETWLAVAAMLASAPQWSLWLLRRPFAAGRMSPGADGLRLPGPRRGDRHPAALGPRAARAGGPSRC